MNRTANLKLSERVILIDVSFLNQTVEMVREVMSARLGRPLPMFDLVAWLDCLLLDAGIHDFSSAEVQVLLVQGTDGDALSVCTPSLLSDLDGKACRTGLAETVFGGSSPICPRHPGEGWEPSGGGFAPLHRPFGRPAFFVAGPRVTEVSLSGSTRRLLIHFSRSTSFRLVLPFGGGPCCGYSVP